MKKLAFLFAAAVVAVVALGSCAETSDRQDREIAYKIENHEELTEDEYTQIINYVGEYAEKAQKFVDYQINGVNQEEALDGMAELKKEYPYYDLFRTCISLTTTTDLSAENLQLCSQYAGYVEFSSPQIEIQTNPQAAGIEVAVPDSANNGVIAGAVDETEVKE